MKLYEELLRIELLPALGCTEPGAVGYAAAKAIEILGTFPEYIDMYCSANIIKNVKSVNVPNSGGMKGIEAAAILGLLAGDPEDSLEIFKNADAEKINKTKKLIAQGFCSVHLAENEDNLYIRAIAVSGQNSAEIVIKDTHTNVIFMRKNNEVLLDNTYVKTKDEFDTSFMTIDGIVNFADNADIIKLKEIIRPQVNYNYAIALEGLKNDYGANVGGIFCDGAKASCAAKIASSVDAAILAHEMAKAGQHFLPGDGIVTDNIEKTIKNFGIVGREGMKETDISIMKLMINC